ncbi:Beta-ketoacyl synthase [Leadbetterella byssophila DSM 17132]|uniref:Beta-ketoacyl synthase n=1 Tax=Leadbetterella byssophila (strain DSM 17132 / JCM 16389 / KACC 11308 / NBRC 106382 / 4M15) TaxID=649349 RepID=E4RXH6_LEAB4|nr:beta-ketoacyl synthase N-terminal-like domain-containing protein [Leadbetterella byssophila]ADQ17211.1 Beta-ketoacyl synthase [Leadbetterella byssophila DSM 17132]
MSFVIDYNCITPLGKDLNSTMQAVEQGKTAVKEHDHMHLGTYYAARFDSTSDLLSLLIEAGKPIMDRFAPSDRDLLLLSTTKGEIQHLDQGVEQVYLYKLADQLASYFGFQNSPLVISNACVSGIQALATAKRLVDGGMYERVYVLAGDLVTDFVLSGFASFQAMASAPCRPYDKERTGVNLGEAAAAVLVGMSPSEIEILGEASINDANHISGPSRTGEGLYRSIQLAIEESKIDSSALDYISAHGTATIYNDEMESIALGRSGLLDVPVNSWKGYFGHTLGTAGLLEAILSFESAKRGVIYPSLGFSEQGTSHAMNIPKQIQAKAITYFMKTASGFGGSNTAVVFRHVH